MHPVLAALAFATAPFFAAVASAQPVPSHGVEIQDLGPATLAYPLLGTAITGDTMFVGSRNLAPTRVAGFDFSQNRVTSSFTLGDGVYVQSLALSDDRFLYAGVSAAGSSPNLYRCDLHTGTATGVAFIPGQSVAALAIAPDGIVYATGRPENRTLGPALFSYNPQTGIVTNLGTPAPNAGQALGLAVTETTVYFGSGSSSAGGGPAGLFAIDRASGTIANILPSQMAGDGGINKIEIFDEYLAVGGSRVGVMNLETGEWRLRTVGGRQHQFLRLDNNLLVTSTGGLHQIDLDSFATTRLGYPGEGLGDCMGLGTFGHLIVGSMSGGHIWTFDRTTGETQLHNLIEAGAPGDAEPGQSVGVLAERVYVGGNNSVAIHNLQTGAVSKLAIPGEVKDMISVGDVMYMATYAPAALWEHRPKNGTPPRRLTSLPASQNRPHVVQWDAVNQLLAIGTRSDSGGGGLSLWNPATEKLTAHINPLGNQQWIWNAAPSGGLIYIAGAISGGGSGDIAAFDPVRGQIVWRMEDPLGGDGGISSMAVIGQRLFGVTVRNPRFFVIDLSSPQNPRIIYETPLGPLAGNSGALVRLLADRGLLYGVSDETLFSIDPTTLERKLLIDNVGADWFSGSRLAAGDDRALYTLSGRNLIQIRPQTLPRNSFFDDFNRPDEAGPGPDWISHAGNWEIIDNSLRPAPNDMTLEKLIIHPGVEINGAFTIEAEIDWPTLRNQWNGIVWNYQNPETYYTLQVRDLDSNIRVQKRTAGKTTIGFPAARPGPLDPTASYFLRVSGDGHGNFWWSFGTGMETLGSGSFFDPDPLPSGPAGLIAVRESFQVNSFRIDTYGFNRVEGEFELHTAVELVFPTKSGAIYLLERSDDLQTWDTIETLTGDGNELSRLQRIRGSKRRFYRLTIVE